METYVGIAHPMSKSGPPSQGSTIAQPTLFPHCCQNGHLKIQFDHVTILLCCFQQSICFQSLLVGNAQSFSVQPSLHCDVWPSPSLSTSHSTLPSHQLSGPLTGLCALCPYAQCSLCLGISLLSALPQHTYSGHLVDLSDRKSSPCGSHS